MSKNLTQGTPLQCTSGAKRAQEPVLEGRDLGNPPTVQQRYTTGTGTSREMNTTPRTPQQYTKGTRWAEALTDK